MKTTYGLCAVMALTPLAHASISTYSFTDLGACSDSPAINASGHVTFTAPGGAVVWYNGATTPIAMGSAAPIYAGAKGINSFGDVAGYHNTSSPSANINGAPIDFSTILTQGYGRAINDNRTALLQASSGQGTYLYHAGTVTTLNASRSSTGLVGENMNNLDQVVGEAQLNGITNYRAYLWSNGVFTTLNPSNIPANNWSAAFGINDQGTIVGEYELSSTSMQPWRRSADGQFTLLGQPPSNDLVDPLAVNSANLVVGLYRQTSGGYRAVAWDGTTPIPLTSYINQPGWSLDAATSINDAGQIVGSGTVNGATHAFLLNPVPAPAPIALLAASALMTGPRRRRTG